MLRLHVEVDSNAGGLRAPVSRPAWWFGPSATRSDKSSLREPVGANGSASNYLDLPAGNGSLSDSMSRKELIREVTERARPFYKAIWLRCSKEEKLTLIFIALDGFVVRRTPNSDT